MAEVGLVPKEASGRIGIFLISDDIRSEADGKHSLMGIYGGETISLPSLPFTFSKLCFYISIIGLDPGEYEFLSKLTGPDNAVKPLARNSIKIEDSKSYYLHLVVTSLDITVSGEYKLVLKFDGANTGRMTTILSKSFQLISDFEAEKYT